MKAVFDKKLFAKRTLRVFLSNAFLLCASLLTGFFVPKFLGKEQYGMFSTFTLYAGYISVLQFGFVHGIYLKFGDKNLDELDPARFRLFTRLLLFVEAVISVAALAIAFACFTGFYRHLLVFLAFYSVSYNLYSYFQQLSQITQRFKLFSRVTLLNGLFKIIEVGILFIAARLNVASFEFYTFIYVFFFGLLFAVDGIFYRHFIFGKALKLKKCWGEIKDILKMGLPLYIADFVLILIYASSRQVANSFYPKEEYAHFALAYTALNLITTLVSAVSSVLYPTMKRLDEKEIIDRCSDVVSLMLSLGFFALLAYYAVVFIINRFLPAYSPTIHILKVVFPGVVITSTINIVIQNYFKTLNKNWAYFFISLGVLGAVAGGCVAAQLIFGSMEAIAAVSVFVYVVWFVMLQTYLNKKYGIKMVRNSLYAVLMLASFYFFNYSTSDTLLSLFTYLLSYCVITPLFFLDKVLPYIKHRVRKPTFERLFGSDAPTDAFANRKKSIVVATLLPFLFFSGLNVATAFLIDSAPHAISQRLCNERAASQENYAYVEVEHIGTDYFNVDDFFAYNRDPISTDLRASSRVFLSSYGFEANEVPLAFRLPDDDYVFTPSIICNYTADYQQQYYGFELMFPESYQFRSDADSYSFYISESLANEMIKTTRQLGTDYVCTVEDYEALMSQAAHVQGKYYKYGRYYESAIDGFTIEGIILDSSSIDYRKLVGDSFVFCQFNGARYLYADNCHYSFMYYGGVIPTASSLRYVLDFCAKKADYDYLFFDHIDGALEVGETQAAVIKTVEYSKAPYRMALGIGGMIICLASLVLFLIGSLARNKAASLYRLGHDYLALLLMLTVSFLLLSMFNGIPLGGVLFFFGGYVFETAAILALACYTVYLLLAMSGQETKQIKEDIYHL